MTIQRIAATASGLIAASLFTGMALTACNRTSKDANKSNVEGVDEILNGGKTVQGTRYCGPVDMATAAALTPAATLAKVKMALPQPIADVVVINVAPAADVHATCAAILKKEGQTDQAAAVTDACWEIGDASRKVPIVHLTSDNTAIHDYLIPTAAEAYDGSLKITAAAVAGIAVADVAKLPQASQDALKDLQSRAVVEKDLRRKIAAAVLDDIASTQGADAVKNLETKLAVLGDPLESASFSRFLFEEVVDAAYCNQDTAQRLATLGFVKTHALLPTLLATFGAAWFSDAPAAEP